MQTDSLLIGEIIEKIEVLRMHPELGRTVREFDRPTLWKLIHPPLCIVYRRELDSARIIRIWRSERLLRRTDE